MKQYHNMILLLGLVCLITVGAFAAITTVYARNVEVPGPFNGQQQQQQSILGKNNNPIQQLQAMFPIKNNGSDINNITTVSSNSTSPQQNNSVVADNNNNNGANVNATATSSIMPNIPPTFKTNNIPQQQQQTQQQEVSGPVNGNVMKASIPNKDNGPLVVGNLNQYIKLGVFHILGTVTNNDNQTTFNNVNFKITFKDGDSKLLGIKIAPFNVQWLEPGRQESFDIVVNDNDVSSNIGDIMGYSIHVYANRSNGQ